MTLFVSGKNLCGQSKEKMKARLLDAGIGRQNVTITGNIDTVGCDTDA
jgi:hypothetical protein